MNLENHPGNFDPVAQLLNKFKTARATLKT